MINVSKRAIFEHVIQLSLNVASFSAKSCTFNVGQAGLEPVTVCNPETPTVSKLH